MKELVTTHHLYFALLFLHIRSVSRCLKYQFIKSNMGFATLNAIYFFLTLPSTQSIRAEGTVLEYSIKILFIFPLAGNLGLLQVCLWGPIRESSLVCQGHCSLWRQLYDAPFDHSIDHVPQAQTLTFISLREWQNITWKGILQAWK